ncbi:anti-sigma factor family protein [Dyella telluris]|uniref:Anti-sigma factor n=1 Tax=Dyella telluris TaxID=2763498 RepID=A0A7G8Q170_9GAMM|nr:zf-HC2 domain-containing protein [Dyella telluris]QNK00528.1 anti-sigma factor [Dyella telluris]
MMCDDAGLLMHAYLDDELDAAGSAAMARHLDACAACKARYETYAIMQKALSEPTLYRRAPDALRARWSTPAPAVAARPHAARRRSPWVFAAAAGFAAAMLLSTPAWLHWLPARGVGDAVVAQAISSHVRSLQGEHLMDVVSTDQHTVKPWFEGKLDFSPRVKDLAAEGFPLVGGRLDALEGHSVAALVYKRRLHVINLFQWPAEGTASAQAIAQEHGYTVIRWTGDGMRYVAISDVNEGDLKQFVLAFQNEANPAMTR